MRAHFKASLPWYDEPKRQPTKDNNSNNNALQPQQNLGQKRAISRRVLAGHKTIKRHKFALIWRNYRQRTFPLLLR